MPKLWNETIKGHRHDVRAAILSAAAALVAENGLRPVTMSQIAVAAGIGRATLYKYFSGVEEILSAWHERQVGAHFQQLAALHNRAGSAGQRLRAVLEVYAFIAYEYHGTELAALVHQGEHFARAQQHLNDLVRDLLREAVETGDVRGDVAPAELATYCLDALEGAGSLQSKAAVRRLVQLTLAGLRPVA